MNEGWGAGPGAGSGANEGSGAGAWVISRCRWCPCILSKPVQCPITSPSTTKVAPAFWIRCRCLYNCWLRCRWCRCRRRYWSRCRCQCRRRRCRCIGAGGGEEELSVTLRWLRWRDDHPSWHSVAPGTPASLLHLWSMWQPDQSPMTNVKTSQDCKTGLTWQFGQETFGYIVRLYPPYPICPFFSICLLWVSYQNWREGNLILYLNVGMLVGSLYSNFKVFKCAETDAGAFALLLRVKVKW